MYTHMLHNIHISMFICWEKALEACCSLRNGLHSQAHNGSLGLCDCRTGCARWKGWSLFMLADYTNQIQPISWIINQPVQ